MAGLTTAELLMALAIAGVILGQVCLLWLYSSRSFAAQMNYADMDQKSQKALDILTQNIRQCKGLTNFTTTRITLLDYDGKALTFTFDKGQLVRSKSGSLPRVLLKDCTTGEFAMYLRTPIPGGFDNYPTTDPLQCKLVEVRWTCSKKLSPTAPTATEAMQSARIVMRTK